jgi:hypothetical protein
MGAFINGFDNQELDQPALWPKAFELNEDGEKNVLKFKENSVMPIFTRAARFFSLVEIDRMEMSGLPTHTMENEG